MSAEHRQRIVVKVGTSILTAGTPKLNRQRMLQIVQQCVGLQHSGCEVVLVSSGAVAAGRERMGFATLDAALPVKQMLAAIGQGRLMQLYAELFDIFQIIVAQVLLTREDLNHRTRFLNARDTLLTLIDQRVIPIINENDTTATHEIRVGDNDNLSALVATLIEADLLVLLTDQAGLFTADPRQQPDAQLIPLVKHIDETTYSLAGGSVTGLGTGGMVTKIQAAQTATRAGVVTVIADGRIPDALMRLQAGEMLGTRFEPNETRIETRKRWLMMEKPHGSVWVDAGAAKKLLTGGASLLPVGVTSVQGDFDRGMPIAVLAPDGRVIAHGLTSYDSADARKLCGVRSGQISQTLGYSYGDALVHRNNMVLLR